MQDDEITAFATRLHDHSEHGRWLFRNHNFEAFRLVRMCRATFEELIDDDDLVLTGDELDERQRQIAMLATNRAKADGMFDGEHRTGFWEQIVFSLALIVIKWLWEKWKEREK